jgi:hypothetical protein
MLLNVKLFLVVTPPTGGPNTTGFTVDFVDNINEALSDSIYIIWGYYSLTPTTENVKTCGFNWTVWIDPPALAHQQ